MSSDSLLIPKRKAHLRNVRTGQCGAVVDAVCQVGDVEAGEGIGGAGVAADGQEARVEQAEGEDVKYVTVGLD